MYGAQVMGATRLQVMNENDRRARPVRQYQTEAVTYETGGGLCFKYILFYLFLTAMFVQVWLVVATSNNLPSIIITAILTFVAIVVLIWRHIIIYNRRHNDEQLQRNRILQGTLQRQERSTIMLRPLGLSMRNIPEQSSSGISQSLLMTLPTFTYTPMVSNKIEEEGDDADVGFGGKEEESVSTYSVVAVRDEESGLSENVDIIVARDDQSGKGIVNTNNNNAYCPRYSSTCIVCLLDYLSGDELVLLPCGHEYHRTCIFTWLSCHKFCPVCKQEVNVKPTTLTSSSDNEVNDVVGINSADLT